MAVAGALWLAPAQSVAKHRWRQKIQRHIELCHVQVLAASTATTIIEGRDNGGKRKAWHNEVSLRPVGIRRGAIGPARQFGHAAQGREHWAKARLPRIGPSSPQHRRAE